ncbi:MAG: ACT domain-containing protein [[Lactobacillus] timonensis]|jgi:ACT domain-containing protein|uniref:ACT domain-containing protein n=1 Tax=[Lactobacillus] timonensis TaxID=1970790 RepID=UPI002353A0F8|nr:ACT domain-containing protein [[Lactobacillus] timonensis]MCI1970967.1 ACT domain-containing protein [[Lactobacillus] timonensis]
MKAILTTIGKDRPGIVAGVSKYLASNDINILDISQTIMGDNFTMMMLVQVSDQTNFQQLLSELKQLGQQLSVTIDLRNEELYRAMQQL